MSFLSAYELRSKCVSGDIAVSEAILPFLAQHKKVDSKIKAFIELDSDNILKQARKLESLPLKQRESKKLFGVPVAIKDNICVEGMEVTCASKILKGFYAPYDAQVISKLKEAGAILYGRTNMDEFAMGSSTETSSINKTANPWDLGRIPGGSSGGAAASIASGQVPLAIGSDTGGSIRQPAALCGVAGLKPTYGRVSRYGLIAFASSLDQIGPFAKDIRDAAMLLEVLSGHDPKDSTSSNEKVPDYLSALNKEVKGLTAGIPDEYFIKGIDPEIEATVRKGIDQFEKLGVKIEKISLPHTKYAVATYYIVATAEASSNLARYDGVRYGARAAKVKNLQELYFETRSQGFGDEVKRRIMLGTYVLSAGYYDAYYLKALKVRTLMKQDFDTAFKKVDFILTPTSPTPAFKMGEKMSDPLSMYLSDIFTISVNLAGLPGLSIPCGFTKDKLPVGLQLIGKPFGEETLLQAGHQFQLTTPYHRESPKL